MLAALAKLAELAALAQLAVLAALALGCQGRVVASGVPLSEAASAPAPTAPHTAPAAAAPAELEPSRGKRVDAAVWSVSGRFVAASCLSQCEAESESSPILVWDTHRARLHRVVHLPESGGRGGHVAFSADERFVAAGGHDRVRVWRLSDGAQLLDSGAIATYGRFAFSPDGTRFIWGNVFGTVQLHDVEGQRLVRAGQLHPGAASLGVGFAFDAAGQSVTIHTEGLGEVVWDATTGKDRRGAASVASAPPEWSAWGLSSVSSDDGERRAWGHANGYLAVSGPQGLTLLRRPARAPSPSEVLPNLAFSVDGGRLAVADATGAVELWVVAERAGWTLLDEDEGVRSPPELWFSPHGERLVVARDGALWSGVTSDQQPPTRLHDPSRPPSTEYSVFAWRSADELLVRSSDGVLGGWSAAGEVRWRHPVGEEASLSLSHDGRFVAVVEHELVLLRLSDRKAVTLRAQRDNHGNLEGLAHPAHSEAEMKAFLTTPVAGASP